MTTFSFFYIKQAYFLEIMPVYIESPEGFHRKTFMITELKLVFTGCMSRPWRCVKLNKTEEKILPYRGLRCIEAGPVLRPSGLAKN